MTLVVNRSSVSVNMEANHIVIRDHAGGGGFQRVSLVDVERVIVAGQPSISFNVLAKLMDPKPCAKRWIA